MRRVLTNTRVVACAVASSAMRAYTCAHCGCDITGSSGVGGSSSARSRGRSWPMSMITGSGAAPARKRATASTGFWVADSPIRWARRPVSASSRASDSARWLPRLLCTRAWISSTITVRTPPSIARPEAELSRMYSDSGVVTSTCGGCRRRAARSPAGVSPVRTAVRIATSGRPSRASSPAIPASGASRLRWMSLDSAFSGETYSTQVASGSPCARPSRTRPSSAARKPVRVLPAPVGAATSTSLPVRIAGHARSWAGVGAVNVRANHPATAGWNAASTGWTAMRGLSAAPAAGA